MHKNFMKAFLSILLAVAMCLTACTGAFAASSGKKSYVKEVFLSYGNSDSEAKSYLKNKGYEVLDYNLNEGADDTFSTKRSVYLGYKTTTNADEAITDMKLMNMKGGYSVQDYEILLKEEKANIKVFFNNFKVAIKEYRENYNKGQERAVAAHDMLNLLYDDDTQQNLGDLLLNKVKEEYGTYSYNKLSDEVKSKTADMTTILMQANGTAVLTIEQLIALATDSGDSVWAERYSNAETYDEMIENLMNKSNVDMSKAVSSLASKYDSDAKAIASKLEDYKSYLKVYSDAEVKLSNTEDEIKEYLNKNDGDDLSDWYAAGAQYEALSLLENDGVSLLDLITSDEYDLENDDRYMLYPLVSVLTDGQRACLDFLPMYQLVSIGINNNDAMKSAMDKVDVDSYTEGQISIYEGVDRSIYSSQVALTGDAYKLQNSSDKDASENWFSDGISTSTKVMYVAFTVSTVAAVASLVASSIYKSSAYELAKKAPELESKLVTWLDTGEDTLRYVEKATLNKHSAVLTEIGEADSLSRALGVAGFTFATISLVLMGWSAMNTYLELRSYYTTYYTPIPAYMVNQGVNENNEKVFTYYKAVDCNREDAGMVTVENSALKSSGDINGDVGKEWVALYTTKDTSAGNPITADFIVQYENSNIPGDDTPLSMFGESVAQNLTNEKAGYTYSDDEDGIYLFYGTDDTVYAGSVFSNSTYVLIGIGALVVVAAITYFICRAIKKKKSFKGESNNA